MACFGMCCPTRSTPTRAPTSKTCWSGGPPRLPSERKFDAAEIRALFANGTPVMRVMVLGLMGGDPSLVDVASLAEGIASPATRTEQYEALRLTERLWERFSGHERAMLRAATQGVPIAKNSRRA